MTRRRLNQFQSFEKNAPNFPDYTCPHIDDAISALESLRETNGELRDCVEYWRDSCEQMQEQVTELESWKTHIKLYVKDY